MSGRNCLCDIQWWETSYFRISTQSQLWLAGWCAKHGDPSLIHADLCGPGKPFITLSFIFWQTFGFFSNGPKKSSFTHSYTVHFKEYPQATILQSHHLMMCLPGSDARHYVKLRRRANYWQPRCWLPKAPTLTSWTRTWRLRCMERWGRGTSEWKCFSCLTELTTKACQFLSSYQKFKHSTVTSH